MRLTGEIIKELRDSRGYTQTKLAELMDVKSYTTIAKWESNENSPRGKELKKLSSIFNVSTDYILGLEDIRNFVPDVLRTVNIPIIGKIACGDPIDAFENVEGYILRHPDSLPKGKIIALRTSGDSMSPTIPHGAIAIVKIQPEVENGQIAAILMNSDEEATIKRIRKQGDNIILSPDNKEHQPIIANSANPVRILGKVIGFEMQF